MPGMTWREPSLISYRHRHISSWNTRASLDAGFGDRWSLILTGLSERIIASWTERCCPKSEFYTWLSFSFFFWFPEKEKTKRIKRQSQANMQFGWGTLDWGPVYFYRTDPIFWCGLLMMTSCVPVRFPCARTPPGGSKSMSRAAHCPSALGENEMQSPEHEISFPVIFFYCFASCISFFLISPPPPPTNPQPIQFLELWIIERILCDLLHKRSEYFQVWLE